MASARDPARREPTLGLTLAVIAVGGAAGACARYGAARAWPPAVTGSGWDAFPWSTFTVNIVGCSLIGVLMVTLTEARPGLHPLLRPMLGTGVLGGFTTFSTYAVDVQQLLASGGRAQVALAYLATTVGAALAAVWLSTWAARRAFRVAGRGRGSRDSPEPSLEDEL